MLALRLRSSRPTRVKVTATAANSSASTLFGVGSRERVTWLWVTLIVLASVVTGATIVWALAAPRSNQAPT